MYVSHNKNIENAKNQSELVHYIRDLNYGIILSLPFLIYMNKTSEFYNLSNRSWLGIVLLTSLNCAFWNNIFPVQNTSPIFDMYFPDMINDNRFYGTIRSFIGYTFIPLVKSFNLFTNSESNPTSFFEQEVIFRDFPLKKDLFSPKDVNEINSRIKVDRAIFFTQYVILYSCFAKTAYDSFLKTHLSNQMLLVYDKWVEFNEPIINTDRPMNLHNSLISTKIQRGELKYAINYYVNSINKEKLVGHTFITGENSKNFAAMFLYLMESFVNVKGKNVNCDKSSNLNKELKDLVNNSIYDYYYLSPGIKGLFLMILYILNISKDNSKFDEFTFYFIDISACVRDRSEVNVKDYFLLLRLLEILSTNFQKKAVIGYSDTVPDAAIVSRFFHKIVLKNNFNTFFMFIRNKYYEVVRKYGNIIKYDNNINNMLLNLTIMIHNRYGHLDSIDNIFQYISLLAEKYGPISINDLKELI